MSAQVMINVTNARTAQIILLVLALYPIMNSSASWSSEKNPKKSPKPVNQLIFNWNFFLDFKV